MMLQHTHLGAYALIVRDEAVLLIRKARGPYTGQWDLPGGKIEFGESPREAMRREVEEETGLRVQRIELLDGLSCRLQYQNPAGAWVDLHHLGFLYRAEVADDAPPLCGGDGRDSEGAAWLPLTQLHASSLSPFARAALTEGAGEVVV